MPQASRDLTLFSDRHCAFPSSRDSSVDALDYVAERWIPWRCISPGCHTILGQHGAVCQEHRLELESLPGLVTEFLWLHWKSFLVRSILSFNLMVMILLQQKISKCFRSVYGFNANLCSTSLCSSFGCCFVVWIVEFGSYVGTSIPHTSSTAAAVHTGKDVVVERKVFDMLVRRCRTWNVLSRILNSWKMMLVEV